MTSGVAVAAPSRLPRLVQGYAYLGWLALPMLFYLIPLFEGYAWSALGYPPQAYNVLNPPEEYRGRLPATRITAEPWGASVVIVPFHARQRQYLLDRELPLWNPYSGLGQVFAAQGEGSPYFPVSVLRSLLPYSLANYVTVGFIYLSSVCTYLFMLRLGVTSAAALFAAVAWSLSGAASLHLARPNFADQTCMVPILFWAVLAAVQVGTLWRYVVLALVSGLHLLAGHIQIAMLSGLTAPMFGVWYTWLHRAGFRTWATQTLVTLGAFGLGNALGAFSLFPMLESIRTSFSKNVPNLGFLVPLSDANIVGFLMPYLFGQPLHRSWIVGSREMTVDWDNLFAFSGLVPMALVAAALPSIVSRTTPVRGLFLVFAGGFVALMLRFLSAPPAAALNLLPILDRQSPKHATQVMVFFLVVAAGLALHELPGVCRRKGWIGLGSLLAFLVGLVLTVVGRLGGFSQTDPSAGAFPSLVVTLTIVLLVILALGLCLGRGASAGRSALLLGGVAVAELSLYLPLGNAEFSFLLARLGLSVLVVAAAVLLAFRWTRLGVAAMGAVFIGYAVLVPWPRSGLPRQFEADQPPAFMRWLAGVETRDDRSFGILPDWSSIGPVQDISAVGPMAPPEFLELVRLIADEPAALEYSRTTHFMLAGPWSYNLEHYPRARPIFDWLGVRYLVLNRQYFGGSNRRDAVPLTEPPISLQQVYEDRRVIILMSPEAQSRAEFWSGFVVADDQVSILARLKRDPSVINQAPRIEANQLPANLSPSAAPPSRMTVALAAYHPNRVDLAFDAPSPGLLVLKDVYAPGWSATLNGQPIPVVRVQGLVRGVFIEQPGPQAIQFTYRPDSFVWGLYLSAATSLLMALLVVTIARQRLARMTPSA